MQDKLRFDVTYLPVDRYGMVNPEDVNDAITNETTLITIMHANNEVGTIDPVVEIGQIARERGVPFHTDAAQSCGKIEVDVDKLNVDLLTIAGHKMYAPKGIGALYIQKGAHIDSLIHGASHETGRRAGTENVPYITGLGVAATVAKTALSSYSNGVRVLRDKLYANIVDGIGEARVRLNGLPEKRFAEYTEHQRSGNNWRGVPRLGGIPEIAASTGSACHSGSFLPSKALLGMGLCEKETLAGIRISLGRWTSGEEIEAASRLIVNHACKPGKSIIV